MWEEVVKELPKVAGGLVLSWVFVAGCFGVAAGVAWLDPELSLDEVMSPDESMSPDEGLDEGDEEGDELSSEMDFTGEGMLDGGEMLGDRSGMPGGFEGKSLTGPVAAGRAMR